MCTMACILQAIAYVLYILCRIAHCWQMLVSSVSQYLHSDGGIAVILMLCPLMLQPIGCQSRIDACREVDVYTMQYTASLSYAICSVLFNVQ